MQVTTNVEQATLRRLFSASGPVVSSYFDLGALPEEDAWPRWHALARQLNEQEVDPGTIKALTRRVSMSLPGSGVLAMFATNGELVLAVDMAGAHQPDLAISAPLPHVLPLLAWLQDRPPYVLAIVDRTGADLAAYPHGTGTAVRQTVTGPDDEIERNAPGGCAQMRYQHRAEDSWEHNAARVANALTRTLADFHARLLLLAGDVRALQYLTKHLPERVRRTVSIRRVSGSRSQDGAEKDRAAQVAAQTHHAAQEQTQTLLHRLAEARGPSGSVAEGVRETLDALALGRVQTLVVVDDPQDRRTAWFGPHPTQVSDRREVLARTAAPITRERLIDVAARAAVVTGAEVHVLPPGTSGAPAQGIGALCRFPTAGGG